MTAVIAGTVVLLLSGCATRRDVTDQYASHIGPARFGTRVHVFQDMSPSMTASRCWRFADAREGTDARGTFTHAFSLAPGHPTEITGFMEVGGFLVTPTLRASVEIRDSWGQARCASGPAALLEPTEDAGAE